MSGVAGIWSPVVTPVDGNLAPDADRFVRHATRLLADGCHGLVIFGTTGEAPSFAADERMALLETVVSAGLPPDRIIVGAGCPALTDTVRLIRHAAATGCAGVLVVPPWWFRDIPEEGVFRSYAEVIERCAGNLPDLYLYHFPRLSGVPVTPALVGRIAGAFPGVVAGIKDSGGDWNNTRALLDAHPDLAVFPGSETWLLPALRAGGAGCITATANVNAAAIRAIWNAWKAGDGRVDALQEDAVSVRRAIEGWPLAPALRHILALRYDDPGWRIPRPPLLPLDEDQGGALDAALAKAGFDPRG